MHLGMAVAAPGKSTDGYTMVDRGEAWPPGVLHSVPTTACPQDIGKESDRLDLMSQKVKRCLVWM